ncbi:MAG TPA: VWA domain-containing protein [Armatimonadota bacterium]|nr:VWA domain-containing protein [Armatimonadota bacterium]
MSHATKATLLPELRYCWVPPEPGADCWMVCLSLTAIAPGGEPIERRPLSVCFVIDSSGSMYFSLMSKRELSRWAQIARSRGELATVVTDGRNMTTVVGETRREMMEADVTPMHFVVRAIEGALGKLDPDDEAGVIAFADRGRLIAQGAVGSLDLSALNDLSHRRYVRDLGTGTQLATGLGPCLDWLGERRYSDTRKKVILFSDGLVDDRPRAALSVKRLMQTGASISTFGLGVEFDEDMLAQIADDAGGDYHFMETPDQVAQALEEEIMAERSLVTGDIHLGLRPEMGLTLGDLYQVLPFVKVNEPLRRTMVDRVYSAGAMGAGEERVFLLELRGAPSSPGGPAIEVELYPAPSGPNEPPKGVVSRVLDPPGGAGTATDLEPRATHLARRVKAFAIQRQARQAAEAGDERGAAAKMEALSQVLNSLGESDLAGVAQEEAASLRGETAADSGRTKRLKAATRKITRGRGL